MTDEKFAAAVKHLHITDLDENLRKGVLLRIERLIERGVIKSFLNSHLLGDLNPPTPSPASGKTSGNAYLSDKENEELKVFPLRYMFDKLNYTVDMQTVRDTPSNVWILRWEGNYNECYNVLKKFVLHLNALNRNWLPDPVFPNVIADEFVGIRTAVETFPQPVPTKCSKLVVNEVDPDNIFYSICGSVHHKPWWRCTAVKVYPEHDKAFADRISHRNLEAPEDADDRARVKRLVKENIVKEFVYVQCLDKLDPPFVFHPEMQSNGVAFISEVMYQTLKNFDFIGIIKKLKYKARISYDPRCRETNARLMRWHGPVAECYDLLKKIDLFLNAILEQEQWYPELVYPKAMEQEFYDFKSALKDFPNNSPPRCGKIFVVQVEESHVQYAFCLSGTHTGRECPQAIDEQALNQILPNEQEPENSPEANRQHQAAAPFNAADILTLKAEHAKEISVLKDDIKALKYKNYRQVVHLFTISRNHTKLLTAARGLVQNGETAKQIERAQGSKGIILNVLNSLGKKIEPLVSALETPLMGIQNYTDPATGFAFNKANNTFILSSEKLAQQQFRMPPFQNRATPTSNAKRRHFEIEADSLVNDQGQQ